MTDRQYTIEDCEREARELTSHIKNEKVRMLEYEHIRNKLRVEHGLTDTNKEWYLHKRLQQTLLDIKKLDPDYSHKLYASPSMGKTAYGHTLLSEKDLDEIYTLLCEHYNLTDSELSEIKSNKYYYTKDTVNHYDNEENNPVNGITQEEHKQAVSIQKQLSKEGILNKRSINKASTLNQLLFDLRWYLKNLHRLTHLQEENTDLKSEVESLKATDVVHDNKIKRLEELTGIEQLSKKEQAILLDKANISSKVIASTLDVPYRTVRRWIK